MKIFLSTLGTLALAAAGGALLDRFNIPIAWLLGALGITIVATQLSRHIHVPRLFHEILQPVLGVSLGSHFTPALWGDLARWPEVFAIFAVFIISTSLLGDVYFRRVAGFGRMTAFFAGLPGGLSDLTLVGASMGANIALLGIVHSIRVLLIAVTMPLILAAVAGHEIIKSAQSAAEVIALSDAGLLLVCGVVGYFGGRALRLPAWPVVGPLIVSASVHVWPLTSSSPPEYLINAVQVVLGAYIGSRLVGLRWDDFRSAFTHGVIWSVVLIVSAALFAMFCSWMTGFGTPQLLLAFAPGGITEMGLLALALGSDIALVTTCHTARVLLIYLVVPIASRSGARENPEPRNEEP
jgi:uncharacterized protein